MQNASATPATYTLWQLVAYMLRLGTFGFGGPVALVGFMYRDLVEQRGWISEADYKEGMTLAQIMPGPLAAQLAIYLGYVHYSLLGATLVGAAFVVPSFLMVVALGAAYVSFGGIGWMQAVFYGVGASVIGIITMSAYKLTTKSIGKDRLLWGIYLVSAASTVVTQSEVLWVIVGGGVLVWFVRRKPRLPGAGQINGLAFAAAPLTGSLVSEAIDWHRLGQIAAYFTFAGTFVFGSGLAIVPFLYGGVVKEYAWLTDRQFVDAVAVAMITPGPVVITTGFIGYLASGFWGAVVASVATFLPCYLFTVLPAPYFKKHGKHPGIVAFVDGVTAAAIGAIAGSVIVIGQRSIIDWITVALAVATAAILWRLKKLPEPLVVLAAALIGLAVYPLIHRQETTMPLQPQPLPFQPDALNGLSSRLLSSHYANNYGGAVKRLNAIRADLAITPHGSAPGYLLNGLKREELIATNSMLLHELYFASLGGDGQTMEPAWELAIAANFGSVAAWREQFTACAKALGGGSGWMLLVFQPREGTLVNLWAADHTHAVAGGVPILALDMYEHAYHMDFGAAAGEYVEAFMRNINWSAVYARYQAAVHAATENLGCAVDDAASALIVDVRRAGAYNQATQKIAGADWRDPASVSTWAAELPTDREVVVYCVYGHEVGRVTALRLRSAGLRASYLQGGFDGWMKEGLPLQPK